MIDRRTFIGSSAASLGILGLGACGTTPAAPPINMDVILNRPIVDAHAHVFNAKDLPSFQFLAQVYVEPALGVLSGPVLLLLMAMAYHVEQAAPDDIEESRALGEQTVPRPTTEELVTRSLLTLEQGSLPVRRTNTPTPIARMSAAAAAAPLAVSNDRPETPTAAAQGAAYAFFAGRAGVAPAARAVPLAAASADRVERARQIAARLLAAPASRAVTAAPTASVAPGASVDYEPPGELQQLLNWFQEFTQYRAQRIDAWEKVIGGTGNRFCIPALVDFGISLRDIDETKVPLANQVRVMGKLSRSQKRGRLMHGYVPFNPLRYALRGPPALDLVKEAIEEHGFLGAKLYPPMGFRVSGNEGATPNLDDLLNYLGRPYTSDRIGFARRVDEGLARLFDYCASSDVPIMAHTNPTNLAYYTYRDRPNPVYWREVLSQRPKLRVNFGHFGGAWRKSDDDGERDYAWAREIIRLFADYPHTYGDFADYDGVLEASSPELADLTTFLKNLNPTQKALMRKRLLFGTDWEMLGRTPNNHLFASKMLYFMVDTLGGSVDDYAARNALRFAGLDDDNSLTTKRLVEFHRSGSVNGPTVEEFRKFARS